MNSLQKSKPFQIKKQNIPFDPIVDENDESFDRYGGTKDRHLDQPRGGRKPKQQSYDDSDFKNSLKSDEFYNTKKPNIFVTRRYTFFAYHLGEAQILHIKIEDRRLKCLKTINQALLKTNQMIMKTTNKSTTFSYIVLVITIMISLMI